MRREGEGGVLMDWCVRGSSLWRIVGNGVKTTGEGGGLEQRLQQATRRASGLVWHGFLSANVDN